MKISFPRHVIYVSVATVFLIIFSIWFATAKLIPMGKDFRKNKITLKKAQADLQRWEEFHKQTTQLYTEKKQKNRHIIQAFDNQFHPQEFQREYEKYFISLSISKPKQSSKQEWYEIYDVNTTSKIKSPTNFYKFLDAINKSPWVVEVTFPINFQRDSELLHSSFSMKVYKKITHLSQEENNSVLEETSLKDQNLSH